MERLLSFNQTYVVVLVCLNKPLKIESRFLNLLLRVLAILSHDKLDCPLMFLDRCWKKQTFSEFFYLKWKLQTFQLTIFRLNFSDLRIFGVNDRNDVLNRYFIVAFDAQFDFTYLPDFLFPLQVNWVHADHLEIDASSRADSLRAPKMKQ